ncbi:unnamed protein product (macronuclear) [Paramecium tetraurelia]|uniref:RING-type domain-containing protein n=1 Tax=Paramecium tetraurelia TaxID=5888 RepID=A0CXY9_PARTE|nr:uncharacterized protein GSPATT00011288001 [Paramecium tetraurelia]CAK75656.1 unnamed protein product [Paramecium tetraurelia]|eukprot:XP_001443053.1 hypothetical protein (macronuclear) [Paramecium tetraurelia strain d4-2]
MQNQQHLIREIYLKDKSNAFLRQQWVQVFDSLLPLPQTTLIVDTLQKIDTLKHIQELLSKTKAITVISDTSEANYNWCNLVNKNFEVIVADLRAETKLNSYQYIGIKWLLTTKAQLVIISNDIICEHLINCFNIAYDNIIEIPYLQTQQDELFLSIPYDQKLTYVLQQIKNSNSEIDRDILVYCESLYQMDQIYQAIYFHNQLSESEEFEVHQIIPFQSYYEQFGQQLLEMVYPQQKGKRKVFLTLNYQQLQKYLQNVQQKISLIIHMGYQTTVKKFLEEINAIVYKQYNLSRHDIIIRNRISYFPKIIYLFGFDEFKDLKEHKLIFDEEFTFNPQNIKFYAQQFNVQIDQLQNVVESEYSSLQNYIPLIYYEPLLEAENETFHYYSSVVSTLLTDGEILSEGNVESKKNPFKSFQIHQQRESIIRSNHYWSKMGDITSWIQLINKFIIFIEDINSKDDEKEQENSKNELIKWCRLQNINIPKMILILAYNEYIIDLTQKYVSEYSVINKCCSLDQLKLNRTVSLKKQQSMPEHSEDIQACLLRLFYKGLSIFSGHKSAGYYNYVANQKFKLCYNNLMAIIGDFPLTCIVMALLQKNQQYEIKYSTKIDDIMIPQLAPKAFVKEHKLQFIQRQSLHLNEITFNGIGQVLFNELWKHQSGPQLSQDCILQPNIEMNCITVLYDPNVAKKEIIEQELNSRIKELQNFYRNQVKEIPYENDSKFIMQAGGSMKDWIEKSAYKTFFIEGLPLDITQELLQEFLQEVIISEMKLYKEGDKITARISLQDHDDLLFCLENIKEYKDNQLKVYTQQDQFEHNEEKLLFNEHYKIIITWNLHLNKGIAIVKLNSPHLFNTEEFETIQHLTYKMNLKSVYEDEQTVLADLKQQHKDIDIKSVTIDKQLRYENNGDLQLEIQKLLSNIPQDKYKIDSITKQNCKRILTLNVYDKNIMEQFILLHNQIKQFRGLKVQLNVKPLYYHDYEGPIEMKQIVEEIFDEKKLKLGQYTITSDDELKRVKVTIECWNKQDHEQLNKEIQDAFTPKIIKSSQDFDITVIFSQSGTRFLKFQEESLQILIRQDFINNQLFVNSSQIKYNQLTKAIKEFVSDCSKSIIQIPKNCIRLIMGNDSQGLNEIKKNFDLKSVKFNSISGELQLFGDQKNLDAAIISISEIISSQQQQDKPINALTCNYCFDNMKNGYMLQGCGHKFCLQCIMFSIQNSLGDMTQLPIKCPQCNQGILLADLHILIDEPSWEKLIKLSINKYLQDHAAQIAFCLTPNCPIIHFQKIPRYTCKKCQKQYCNSCRTAYHYGQTCREFKAGNEDSINIYMKKNDVRRCPHCKILIQRIDGCYRVTCTGCKKSICWKNKADGTPCMAIFETSSECYSHLTKEHGGYW